MINDAAAASPFPSPIQVKCVPGLLTNITVTLLGLSHSFPGDIDMLLVSPNGRALKLISDAVEEPIPFDDLTLTFSDAAPQPLPLAGAVLSGTFRPTDHTSIDPDFFIPGALAITNLADFAGASPNGIWGLYVVDDATIDDGLIARGWSVTLYWDDAAPYLESPQMLPDGRLQFVISSQAARTHVIEGSSDLQQWVPLSTNLLSSASQTVIAPTSGTCRFFRAIRCP
jgi:subtilisin-like proprotein convertase family protein